MCEKDLQEVLCHIDDINRKYPIKLVYSVHQSNEKEFSISIQDPKNDYQDIIFTSEYNDVMLVLRGWISAVCQSVKFAKKSPNDFFIIVPEFPITQSNNNPDDEEPFS